MTLLRSACSSLTALALVFAAGNAAAQEAQLGAAVDGRVEAAPSGSAAGVADADGDSDADADADVPARASSRRPPPRSQRTDDRIRGGAGLGVLGAFDDGGSGSLGQVQGRIGAQLNALFGVYAQLGIAAGDMEQPSGADGRAVYATFAVIPELHVTDELAIGLGPVVMAGQRDVDQVGPRIHRPNPFDALIQDEDESVERFGVMLRVSPAIGKVMPSGRIHAFRPSFEIAVLGTGQDVIAPEQHVMVLAGVSLGWDTW